MTHSIDAPLPPPSPTGTASPSTTPSTGERAAQAADAAKGEAANVGHTAAEAGSQVASTATDQAKVVAQETQRQAKDLLEEGRTQLREQTVAQQQKASQGLSSLAQELRGLADGSSQGAPGPARDLLQQASGMVETLADKLQNREPAQLLDEVRAFARRKPGVFLLGAAAAGVLAGRLTSGVRAAHSDSGSGGVHRASGQSNYVDPAPAYSDTGSVAGYTGTAADTSPSSEPSSGAYGDSTATPVPPPPYGTVPPAGSIVPPTAPAGWDDPARRPGGVG